MPSTFQNYMFWIYKEGVIVVFVNRKDSTNV